MPVFLSRFCKLAAPVLPYAQPKPKEDEESHWGTTALGLGGLGALGVGGGAAVLGHSFMRPDEWEAVSNFANMPNRPADGDYRKTLSDYLVYGGAAARSSPLGGRMSDFMYTTTGSKLAPYLARLTHMSQVLKDHPWDPEMMNHDGEFARGPIYGWAQLGREANTLKPSWRPTVGQGETALQQSAGHVMPGEEGGGSGGDFMLGTVYGDQKAPNNTSNVQRLIHKLVPQYKDPKTVLPDEWLDKIRGWLPAKGQKMFDAAQEVGTTYGTWQNRRDWLTPQPQYQADMEHRLGDFVRAQAPAGAPTYSADHSSWLTRWLPPAIRGGNVASRPFSAGMPQMDPRRQEQVLTQFMDKLHSERPALWQRAQTQNLALGRYLRDAPQSYGGVSNTVKPMTDKLVRYGLAGAGAGAAMLAAWAYLRHRQRTREQEEAQGKTAAAPSGYDGDVMNLYQKLAAYGVASTILEQKRLQRLRKFTQEGVKEAMRLPNPVGLDAVGAAQTGGNVLRQAGQNLGVGGGSGEAAFNGASEFGKGIAGQVNSSMQPPTVGQNVRNWVLGQAVQNGAQNGMNTLKSNLPAPVAGLGRMMGMGSTGGSGSNATNVSQGQPQQRPAVAPVRNALNDSAHYGPNIGSHSLMALGGANSNQAYSDNLARSQGMTVPDRQPSYRNSQSWALQQSGIPQGSPGNPGTAATTTSGWKPQPAPPGSGTINGMSVADARGAARTGAIAMPAAPQGAGSEAYRYGREAAGQQVIPANQYARPANASPAAPPTPSTIPPAAAPKPAMTNWATPQTFKPLSAGEAQTMAPKSTMNTSGAGGSAGGGKIGNKYGSYKFGSLLDEAVRRGWWKKPGTNAPAAAQAQPAAA